MTPERTVTSTGLTVAPAKATWTWPSASATAGASSREIASASALGRSLLAVIAGLEDWAESHMDEVIEARGSYDARS